jgi:protein-S-isoprenylcysteine O-methyltransferase Ste14
MNVELICKIVLISVYCLFSVIRIEYYRRARKAGYKTVIEEKRRYAIWLSVFICYEVFTFFAYILFPETLAWGALALPNWLRLIGAGLGVVALLWFVWIHQTLGNNLSARIRIKDSQQLVTNGPYRWMRHPMYASFYLLHVAVFLLTANWFIGVTWMVGLTAIVFLRVSREEAMLLARFGESYTAYAESTGRFLPHIPRLSGKLRNQS